MYVWLKAFHVIAIIAWMAGMLYLPRLFVYHCEAEPGSKQSETFKVMERRLLNAIITPAMMVSWALGLWLAWTGGAYVAGWLQAKVVLVVGLSALHGFFVRWVRDFAADRNRHSQKFYKIINEIPTILMIGIVILAVVKPFCPRRCRPPNRVPGCGDACRRPHAVGATCAWNRLYLSWVHLPERRQIHLVPAQVREPAVVSGLKRLAQDLRFPFRTDRQLFSVTDPLHRTTPYAGNETPRPQGQNTGRACLVRRGARGRKRQHHAQARADVRHSQAALHARDRHHRRRRGRGALRWLRLLALAGSELPARPGRHL